MKMAMLEAALAARLEGPQAVTRVANPYTGEPFEYRKTEHGFELRSPEVPHAKGWNGVLEFR